MGRSLLFRAVLGASLCVLAAAAGAVEPIASNQRAEQAVAPAAAGATEPLLSSDGLLADVDLLERTYTSLHPGLLRYNTPAQMAGHFAALRKEFARDRSLEEAYLAFSVFAATVQCGHTYANFVNQPRAIAQRLFERDTRVPFHFRWLDGRMVITQNHSSDASLVPGTEVLAIDGIAAPDILARLLTVARADGGNVAKRIDWLQVQGGDRYEAFDVFLPLFYPRIGHEQTLRVRSPGDAAPRELHVTALTDAQRRSHTRSDDGDTNAPAWTLTFPRSDLAVLRMPTWALYDSPWDWKTFLRQSFDTLVERRIPALVIDLRGNEGGMGVGDDILARLAEQDLPGPRIDHLVRYRRVPAALVPHLKTWDNSFRDWGDDAVPFDDRYLRLTRYDDTPDGRLVRAVAPRYTGRVFVLVGAGNSSATFEFASQLQASGLGTLVGQATGGNRRGINGGAFFFLHLPNSGIELDVPLIGQFPANPQPDASIEPDIPVAVTVADIAAGTDAEMAAVLARLGPPPSP